MQDKHFEIKPEAKALLDDWFGNLEREILHVWEDSGFYNVVVRHTKKAIQQDELGFYRLFPLAGQYQISCDRTVLV